MLCTLTRRRGSATPQIKFLAGSSMLRVVVGVLRGGPSSEYEVSLNTGASVLEHLDRTKYDPRDLFVDRKGEWHLHGISVKPEKALRGVEVVFNAMHGEYGEDGTVQRLLDTFNVPYTGSGSLPSAIAFNKQRTKEIVVPLGVRVAQGILIEPSHDLNRRIHEIFRTRAMPAVVKPAIGGSSVGVSIVRTFHDLERGIAKAFEISPKVLIEEYIAGKEAAVGVVDDFRGEEHYSLFPIEIIPPSEHTFFDYEAKYSGKTIEKCPGDFTEGEKQELTRVAKIVHKGLGLRHYSRSDFRVSPRGIYFLEVNTLPGLTSESLLPKAVKAVGTKFADFIDHLISLARRKKK